MKGFKGTPFPWFRDQYGSVRAELSTSFQKTVPVVGFSLSGSEEAEANTKFILSAQHLYDALARMVDLAGMDGWNDADGFHEALQDGQKALALASGEE